MPSQERFAAAAAGPPDLPAPSPSCPEELLEATGPRKTGEGRGQGLPEGCLDVYKQRESEQFSGLISDTGAKKMITEYHKPGAPFMDGDERAGPVKAADPPSAFGGLLKGFGPSGLGQVMDVSTIEIAALTVFRALFGQGVAIPIKREGLVDMNVVIMGRDVVINTNRLMLEVPELAIWRIVFAYKGRPILEYGRGVPNKIKIHRYRALQLLAGMWWNGLRNHDHQSERMWRKATVLMMERDAKKKAKEEKRRARAARAAGKEGRRRRSP